ncbi:hypothetical protein JYT20_00030 [Rhodothermus sp. AH-315-K08]|nr:hypothetical protein [Rhodothermus sp. AH-315-K08]
MKYSYEFDSARGICVITTAGRFGRWSDHLKLIRFVVDPFDERGYTL